MNSESQKKNTQNIQRVKIFAFVFFFVFFLLPTTTHAGTLFKNANNLGLLGYWSFNEGTSTVVSDFSGNMNFGTTSNMANPATATSGWGLGRFGYALKFDGINDFIDAGNNPILTPTTSITVSAWIKNNACSPTAYIVSKGDSVSYYLRLQQTGAGCILRFQTTTGAGTVTLDSPQGTLTPGAWQYVVGTWDGSNMRIYRNGVLVGGPTAQTGTLSSATENLQIGTRGSVFSWNGSIDEVKIYSRALSQSEISAQYRGGLVTYKQPSNQGLIGYWSFNDGSGTQMGDFSGNGNNGSNSSNQWNSGKFGGARKFESSSDTIAIPNSPSLNPTSAVTISAWIYPTAWPGNSRVLQKGSTDNQYRLTAEFGLMEFCIFISELKCVTYSVLPQLNVWTHVVGTYDGAVATLYYNGVSVGAAPYTGAINTTSDSLAIGCKTTSACSSTDSFVGKIDEVRIYNRGFSANEVMSLYKTGERAINVSQNNKVKNGLVGLWSFNGPDMDWGSNTAYDRAGSNNGTVSGMSKNTSITVGKVGQALNFDGLSNLVDAGSAAAIDDLGDMSVCAWIKPLASPPGYWAGLVAKSSGASTGWQFYMYGSSPPYGLGFYNTDGDQVEKDSIININDWQHVCGTWDGNAGVTGRKLYLNGTQVASPTLGTSSGPNSDASYSVTIGSLGSAPYLFAGEIDEVRLYSNVLSASDIKQLYNAGR